MKSQLLIGAASSGSGKTTFTLGLLRALKNRFLQVQPFKCGPDYVDTRHHGMAAGCPSINLDAFLMSDKHVHDLYTRYTTQTDVAVTEGVMGLFDGYDRMQGSSAGIAQTLDIPVVLIVNAKSAAYSVAPLLYGFKHFYKEIDVVGAVFNFVASESHYAFLRQACEDVGMESFGYLPKQEEVEIPSRHLGLSLDDDFCFDEFADRVAALVEQHVDIDRLLMATRVKQSAGLSIADLSSELAVGSLRIAIAADAAFNFTYEENVQMLRCLGKVTYFSPLQDAVLPDADFVYLPGGYPELYLPGLSANRSMLQSIYAYAENGGKLLAECGGMMYLCDKIIGSDGLAYPMVNLLPQIATMEHMKLRLGYRTLYYNNQILQGHEFHYSRIIPGKIALSSVAEAYTAKGACTDTPLYRYKNVLAGYTHLYWADPSRNDWFIRYLFDSE